MEPDELLLLVQEAKAGNTQRFLQFMGQQLPALSRLCVSLLHNRADAEEAVQETMLKALKHINQLREGQCVKGWLMQIAVNEARMKMRTNRRFWSHSESDSGTDSEEPSAHDTILQKVPDTRETPDKVLERQELERAAKRALARLEPMYREVLVLRDMQGLSGAHTAAILEIAEATMHTRLHRARLRLRKMLAEYLRPRDTKWKPFRMTREMMQMYRMKVVSCHVVRQQLSGYIDGELGDKTRHEIDEHLKVCSRCMLVLDTLKKTLQLVADEELFAEAFRCKKNWDGILAAFAEATSEKKSQVKTQP